MSTTDLKSEVRNKAQNKEKASGITVRAKLALTSVFLVLLTMVSSVSAGALNETISPVLSDVASLFTPLLALIMAAIPLIIAVSLISFILGIFDSILKKLNI